MPDGVVSVRAQQVLGHIIGNGAEESCQTTLSEIQSILGCGPDVAQVIVEELEAAGYVQRDSSGRLTVVPHPTGGRSGRMLILIDEVTAQVARLVRLADEFDEPWPLNNSRGSDVEVREWAASNGIRAQTLLAIAWEHGWQAVAQPLAMGLARLWTVLDESELALAALDIAQDAASAMHREATAQLFLARAELLDRSHRHDEALAAATSAVLAARESEHADLAASAYGVRGEIQHRGGHSVAALEDFRVAEQLAVRAMQTAPLGDKSALRADPDHTTARLLKAIRQVEPTAIALAAAPDTAAYAGLLVNVANMTNALSFLGSTDAAGLRLARLVRKVMAILPDGMAAEIATVVGNAARTSDMMNAAADFYRLAIKHYTCAGMRHEAAVVAQLLADLQTPAPCPGGGL